MDLLIATEQNSSFIVAAGNAAFSFKIIKRPYFQSELLLKTIDALLSEENEGRRRKGKVKKIFVVAGPGQFSSVRIGVATANGLAFGWGVAVFGLRAKKEWELLPLKQKLLKIWEQTEKKSKHVRGEKSRYVLPIYGSGLNITK